MAKNRVVPGRWIRAESINVVQRAAERGRRLRANAPLHLYDLPTGPVLTCERAKPFWATLSGQASPYDWEEARTLDGGGFDAPGWRSGTGNAYEVNNVGGLNGATVWLIPSAVVDYRFQVPRVPFKETGPGVPCGCGSLPNTLQPGSSLTPTLQMTSSAPGSNFGILQSSALVFGPVPSWASVLSVPPQAYISPGTFTDQLAPNSPFYYVFLCNLGTYGVLRIFETSPYGSPFRDIFRYQWVPGAAGNSCAPLLLANGFIFPNGDNNCVVTISE